MDLHISLDGRRDLAGQIYGQIRAAILDGRLPSGSQLPPTRELASRVDVSRHTVVVAYDRLTSEGLLTGRTGAGTYVTQNRGALVEVRPPLLGGTILHPRPVWPYGPCLGDQLVSADYDFRPGLPDARLFPYGTWRRLLTQEIRYSAGRFSAPCEPAGHPALRAAIARHIGVSRAVRATADDVLVTNGAQQAFDLIGRVLLQPGDEVAVEDPGYLPPRVVFESLGARVRLVPVDDEGLVVDALPERARLVYVTPSHQFPLGTAMSPARRKALLAWVRSRRAAIIEDDYDTEFRYTGRPLDPLQTLDRTGQVIYVGSFSKAMLPTLRLGFLMAPRILRESLHWAKFAVDWHTALPDQLALAQFLDQGLLARHVRRTRAVYHRRHDLVSAAVARRLRPWLELVPSRAGLHVSALATRASTEELHEVTKQARVAGVEIFDLLRLCDFDGPPGLVFGYGAITTTRIDSGLAVLGRCLERVLGAGRT